MLGGGKSIGQQDLWWVGVILSIFAAFFGSLGDNLIKLSYTKEDLKEEAGLERAPLWCRPLWWTGMLCITVLNTSCALIAYTFADASLVIPFGGLHICFNVGFARLLNRERFTSRSVGFTFIILVGVVIVLVSGNHSTATFTVDELQRLFMETGAIVMSVVMFFLILIQIPIALMHYDPRIRCLFSSSLVGTIGACTQVFAKAMSLCIDQAVKYGPDLVFNHFIPYVAISVTAICALAQLTLLNRALAMYNAFVVVPIVNSTLIILGSLYGSILFQEFDNFDLKSEILMPIGVLTTGVGVALLSWDHNPTATDELILGSPLDDEGDIALMPRSRSFHLQRSPLRDSFFEDIPQRSPAAGNQSMIDLRHPSRRRQTEDYRLHRDLESFDAFRPIGRESDLSAIGLEMPDQTVPTTENEEQISISEHDEHEKDEEEESLTLN